MARTVALIAERLPVRGLPQIVIEYVWGGQALTINHNIFEAACEDGYYEICEGRVLGTSSNAGLRHASGGGHMDIVLLMIECGATNWNGGLHAAVYNGHMDIVQLMIERGADEWNWALRCAIIGGHYAIAELMLEQGACNWDAALGDALHYERDDIIALIDLYRSAAKVE